MSATARYTSEDILLNRLQSNPQWGAIYADVLIKIKSGFYENLEIFGQHFMSYSLADAMNYADLHTFGCTGQIFFAVINVEHAPYSDDAIEENNRILQDIPQPFTALFNSGLGDCDGYLKWNSPIKVKAFNILTNKTTSKILPLGRCPLEVGYTRIETTKLHLFSEHFLARWPYNDKYITLMYFQRNDD